MQYLDIVKKYLTEDRFEKTLINRERCFGCNKKVNGDAEVDLVNRSRQSSYTDDNGSLQWDTIEVAFWYCSDCYKKIYRKHRLY
jgi:hypothetical protein